MRLPLLLGGAALGWGCGRAAASVVDLDRVPLEGAWYREEAVFSGADAPEGADAPFVHLDGEFFPAARPAAPPPPPRRHRHTPPPPPPPSHAAGCAASFARAAAGGRDGHVEVLVFHADAAQYVGIHPIDPRPGVRPTPPRAPRPALR
eukprot:COSAG04_NODE_359_length_16002_cov_57.430422_4_plen_148_part_00